MQRGSFETEKVDNGNKTKTNFVIKDDRLPELTTSALNLLTRLLLIRKLNKELMKTQALIQNQNINFKCKKLIN